jgi:hypothetical protein
VAGLFCEASTWCAPTCAWTRRRDSLGRREGARPAKHSRVRGRAGWGQTVSARRRGLQTCGGPRWRARGEGQRSVAAGKRKHRSRADARARGPRAARRRLIGRGQRLGAAEGSGPASSSGARRGRGMRSLSAWARRIAGRGRGRGSSSQRQRPRQREQPAAQAPSEPAGQLRAAVTSAGQRSGRGRVSQRVPPACAHRCRAAARKQSLMPPGADTP